MRMKFLVVSVISIVLLFTACQAQTKKEKKVVKVNLEAPKGRALAAFAEGCFWCSEHIFEAVVGIDSAVSGYAGGTTPNPTYELVNTETTGHAETVLVYYNPNVISFNELVKIFFLSHDPTTRNRQGPDRGSSYRSILFYSTPQEKAIAEKALQDFAPQFKNAIVTELKQLTEFYRAEAYHQNYIEHNPHNPYVQSVSIPRFELFRKKYQGKFK
jgi:peptide-methionine (S)-S-oxide reductase